MIVVKYLNLQTCKIFSKLFIITFIYGGLSACSIIKNQPDKILNSALESQPYDAIIVPGVPYDGESLRGTMKNRILWSQYLFEKGMAKNIIYSGSSVYSEYIESKVMANYGRSLGIPDENIFMDTRAEHSTENVYYSYLVAKKNGFKRIAIASDPFQCNGLVRFIEKHELDIDILPIVYNKVENLTIESTGVDTKYDVNPFFVSIKERELFLERFSGTLGQKIIWHEEDLPNEKLIQKYKRRNRLISESITSSVNK